MKASSEKAFLVLDRQTVLKMLVVAAIIVVDSIWILASDFSFDVASAGKAAAIVGFLVVVAWFYRARRPVQKFEVLCTETALLLAFSTSAAVLSYLMTSINLPLIDHRLLAVDAAFGFDWLAYVGFVNERPWLGMLSTAAYVTTLAQVALTVVLLGTIGKVEGARHFVSAVMAGALLCIFVSAVLPAAGALGTLRPPAEFTAASQPLVDLSYKRTFFDLRSGADRLISLDSLRGLIAFPSYHCTLSALIVVAFFGLGRWFWPVLALNLAVILSTPVDGGHHLTDALAGVLVAFISWKLAGLASRTADRAPDLVLQAAE
jgi:membrane-associated phospholipid phosphatase